ncbi:uncharacterized protein AMSG_05773 [Thecamonas trahens ATCC 50062]|uniref:Uncharacterized protein n=1 Tax=Thecamonas trahens ATCC 50062 TaxID=461836 RepID=A0A0L0DD31_THETB|nr:hypothetical protein AMSG_05773 [Thecamonas trahens ATCC 50062]KNC50016.1 hypothetical protein AMSG_05773 [Thecamonas trahens ATCC 50062]|eukprot:XP_013757183.1 hypothetical protein AMSG_05773 [Thecamonas trahens ATCC 50062]
MLRAGVIDSLSASELQLALTTGVVRQSELTTLAKSTLGLESGRFCAGDTRVGAGGSAAVTVHRAKWVSDILQRRDEFEAAWRLAASCDDPDRAAKSMLPRDEFETLMIRLGLPSAIHASLWPTPVALAPGRLSADEAIEMYSLEVAWPFVEARLNTLSPSDAMRMEVRQALALTHELVDEVQDEELIDEVNALLAAADVDDRVTHPDTLAMDEDGVLSFLAAHGIHTLAEHVEDLMHAIKTAHRHDAGH